MVLGTLPLIALAQLALTVTGDGDASACPDSDVTEQLLHERLDNLAPADHEIQHAFVTDAQSGHSYVRLRLYNANHAMLLERLIPVKDSDCADAPLAIAFIVENYFAGVSGKSPAKVESPTFAESPTTSGRPAEPVSASSEKETREDPPSADPPVKKTASSRVYTGLSFGSEGALSWELGYNYFFTNIGFLDLAVNAQLYKTRYESHGYEMAHTIHSLYLGSGVSLPLAKQTHLSLVPLLGLHYQRAELRGNHVVSNGAKSRLVGSLGLKAELTFALTTSSYIGIGGRANGWLGGPRFLVTIPNESSVELYPLPRIDADGHLVAGFWF